MHISEKRKRIILGVLAFCVAIYLISLVMRVVTFVGKIGLVALIVYAGYLSVASFLSKRPIRELIIPFRKKNPFSEDKSSEGER